MSLYSWCDGVVVRFFRIPPQYDEQLSATARFLYQLGVLVHFAFGFWMFSNRDIVPNEDDFNDASKITGSFNDKVPFSDRANSFQSLIMLFGFVAMGIVYVLYYLFSAFFCCRGVQSHEEQKADLVDCLSYEELMQEYNETRKQIELLQGQHLELRQRLEVKLENLGNVLKKFFKKHGKEEALRLDPKKLPEATLTNFFFEHRVKLIKSYIQGLASYNMMVIYCVIIV